MIVSRVGVEALPSNLFRHSKRWCSIGVDGALGAV